MKYKKWAPAELCDYHREISTKPDACQLQTTIDIEKLITDGRMEYVWGTLESRGGCDPFDIVGLVSTNGPQGIDSLNGDEREKIKARIYDLTEQLGDMIKNTVPYIPSKDAFPNMSNNESGGDQYIHLPSLLKNINDYAEKQLNSPVVYTRNDSKVVRKYFVRSCYSYFMKKFSRPLDEVTATLGLVFIDNINDGLNEIFNKDNVKAIRRGYKIEP